MDKWWPNHIGQILVVFSFFLVTPQFIGKDLLDRLTLASKSGKLMRWWGCASVAMYVPALLGSALYAIPGSWHLGFDGKELWDSYGIALGVAVLLALFGPMIVAVIAFYFTRLFSSSEGARQKLFVAGVVVFLGGSALQFFTT